MGNLVCSCDRADDDFDGEEFHLKERNIIDNIIIPPYSYIKLNFLKNFEEKFNILKNIQLVDFINLLNNFRIEDISKTYSRRASKFSDFMISKENWVLFFENKIFNFCTMPLINTYIKKIHVSFYEDVFVNILNSYNYFYESSTYLVPKAILTSFAFNYCNMKLSQKISIFMNLFLNKKNEIEFNNQLYTFLYCLFSLAFDMPIKFILKNNKAEILKECFNIKNKEEFEFLQNEDDIDRYLREFFLIETSKIFGEDGNKKYKKEDFRQLLLNPNYDGALWIFSNNGIRSRIEKFII